MTFSAGMTVRSRGQRCVVLDTQPIVGGEAPSNRLRLRVTEGLLRGQEWPVVDTLEKVTPDELPSLSLERVGRDARFRLLHEAFQLTLTPPLTALIATGRSRIRFHLYQQIPALRMLSLPRPRILNASREASKGIFLSVLGIGTAANAYCEGYSQMEGFLKAISDIESLGGTSVCPIPRW